MLGLYQDLQIIQETFFDHPMYKHSFLELEQLLNQQALIAWFI